MSAAGDATGPVFTLADDHALLVEAMRAAGAVAMGYFGGAQKSWEKRPGHRVSDADLAVNARLDEVLRGGRPAYGWLSEESDDDPARLDVRRVWIVDPIDGTNSFLKGRPEFSVSAALAVDGAPAAAAVFNPATGELFDAVRGGGARRNGDPMRVTDAATLDGARLVISRTEERRAEWHAGLPGVDITPLSSMAYKLALVAAGRFDATVTLWPKSEWDIAAADLLVREAGGRVTDAEGAGFTYNLSQTRFPSIVAAGARLHERLIERLAGLG